VLQKDRARTWIGIEPRDIAPLYDSVLVVDALLRAAERPQRDIVLGNAGRVLALV
jgi:hypothetical protein